MKRGSKSCLLIFLGVAGLLIGVLYLLAAEYSKSGLKHALNLERLPGSTRIEGTGGESWTDYLFEADIEIDPAEFQMLLTGRKFEPGIWKPNEIDTDWILGFVPMAVDEHWRWDSNKEEGISAGCSIFVNDDRSRVFVRYISD